MGIRSYRRDYLTATGTSCFAEFELSLRLFSWAGDSERGISILASDFFLLELRLRGFFCGDTV
jgi:hypothetical protein